MATQEPLREAFLRKLGPSYASAYPQSLESQFPLVFEKIDGLWGSREMEPYFESLLVTQRADRQGFPVKVAEELLRLYSIYHKLGLARRESQQAGDIWNWVDQVGYFEKAAST